MKGIVNIIILVIGIVLLVLGYNEYDAIGARAGRVLGIGISDKVLVLFIAGAACTVFGLVRMQRNR